MVFNTTFNNILVISWLSVSLVEETGGPGENHRPVASHAQTLSHNVVHKHAPINYLKIAAINYIILGNLDEFKYFYPLSVDRTIFHFNHHGRYLLQEINNEIYFIY